MPDPRPWDHFVNNNPVFPDEPHPVIVVGAGLAGCWMARTLAEAGVRVVVIEQGATPASGGSSNPAGIVKPFVTRTACHAMSFYVEAHDYLLQQLHAWRLADACEFTNCGVTQLVEKPYPVSSHYRCLSADEMRETLGLPSGNNAINFDQSGWLNPAALCFALLKHPLIEEQYNCTVASLKRSNDLPAPWHIELSDNHVVYASHLVLCTGTSLPMFAMSRQLPITPARGQISRFKQDPVSPALKQIVSGKHYVIPDKDTVLVGATFERGNSDDTILAKDNNSNLNGLAKTLSSLRVCEQAIEAYAGVRATTPDRLPVVGPLPDTNRCATVYADLQHGRKPGSYASLPVHTRAYVLGGLGSRGIVTAPFTARLLADFMLGGADINTWSALINPARFQIRNLKRGKLA